MWRFTRKADLSDPNNQPVIAGWNTKWGVSAKHRLASFRRAEECGIVTAIPLLFSVGVLARAIGFECEFHFGDVNETIAVPNDVLADVAV